MQERFLYQNLTHHFRLLTIFLEISKNSKIRQRYDDNGIFWRAKHKVTSLVWLISNVTTCTSNVLRERTNVYRAVVDRIGQSKTNCHTLNHTFHRRRVLRIVHTVYLAPRSIYCKTIIIIESTASENVFLDETCTFLPVCSITDTVRPILKQETIVEWCENVDMRRLEHFYRRCLIFERDASQWLYRHCGRLWYTWILSRNGCQF